MYWRCKHLHDVHKRNHSQSNKKTRNHICLLSSSFEKSAFGTQTSDDFVKTWMTNDKRATDEDYNLLRVRRCNTKTKMFQLWSIPAKRECILCFPSYLYALRRMSTSEWYTAPHFRAELAIRAKIHCKPDSYTLRVAEWKPSVPVSSRVK